MNLLQTAEGLEKEVPAICRRAEIIQTSFLIGPEAQISVHAENVSNYALTDYS